MIAPHLVFAVRWGLLVLCTLFIGQAAQAYDRPALQAAACGDGVAEAARVLASGMGDASADDLAWGRGFVAAVLGRTLDCNGERSPVVSLRNRGTLR